MKEALNIYTLNDNWCFWDSGDKGANGLEGAGEGDGKIFLPLPPNTTKLELVVSDYGLTDFRAPSDYERFLINFKCKNTEAIELVLGGGNREHRKLL